MTLRERLQAAWQAWQRWYAGHSQRDQRVILAVLVAAGLSLVYVVAVEPIRDYRRAIAESIEEGQARLERDSKFLGAAEGLRAERAALKKRLEEAKRRLLPGGSGTLGAAALQERANAIAKEKGVTVQSTQVMRESEMAPFHKVAVRLTLAGELEPMVQLISGLEHGQQLTIPFIEMSRRGASVKRNAPRRLSATMEVNGFVQSGNDGTGDEAEEDAFGSPAGREEFAGPPQPASAAVGPPVPGAEEAVEPGQPAAPDADAVGKQKKPEGEQPAAATPAAPRRAGTPGPGPSGTAKAGVGPKSAVAPKAAGEPKEGAAPKAVGEPKGAVVPKEAAGPTAPPAPAVAAAASPGEAPGGPGPASPPQAAATGAAEGPAAPGDGARGEPERGG